jgi:2-methylcitrate dehydratase
VTLSDGRTFRKDKSDYEGFHTRPMSWAKVEEKFHRLAENAIDVFRRDEIVKAVRKLDGISIKDLMPLLS